MTEFTRNDLERIMETLLKKSRKNRQEWKLLKYYCIPFQEEKKGRLNKYSVSHGLKVQTKLSGQVLTVEIIEKIYLPSEKGDIVGLISYNGKCGIQVYYFGLSYEWEKYDKCNPEEIYSEFRDSIIVKLSEELLNKLISNNTIRYENVHKLTDNIRSMHPKSILYNKMLSKHMILEFHKCILDMSYRKKVMAEI